MHPVIHNEGNGRPRGRPVDLVRAPCRAAGGLLAAVLAAMAAPANAQGVTATACAAAVTSMATAECLDVAAARLVLPADLTPRQLRALKQRHGAKLLLIDVRTPQEVRVTGVADVTDHVVPVRSARPGTAPDALPPSSAMVDDPAFVENLRSALLLAGAEPSTPVAVICRTGNRSGIAAQRLRAAGWVNVSNVIGGLDGKTNAFDDDEMGWRAAKLPMAPGVDTPL